MHALCNAYIRRDRLIGALYCIVPTLLMSGIALTRVEFRSVYAVRLAVSCIAGGFCAALVNEFGLHLWVVKHRSEDGPGTVIDGALVGAAIGMASQFIPALTLLYGSQHPELAKTFIIGIWCVAVFVGGVVGGLLAVVGRSHLTRERDPKHYGW